ncbi:MAG: hypothetical protein ACRDD2_10280 [Sarcina sp.]
MRNINIIFCTLYFILGVLNISSFISIKESVTFGIAVGTLFLCLATLVEEKLVRKIFYLISIGFMVVFPMVIEAFPSLEINKYIDSNSWIILSSGIILLSNYLNKEKIKKRELRSRNAEKVKRKDEIEMLKSAITVLQSQINDMDKKN